MATNTDDIYKYIDTNKIEILDYVYEHWTIKKEIGYYLYTVYWYSLDRCGDDNPIICSKHDLYALKSKKDLKSIVVLKEEISVDARIENYNEREHTYALRVTDKLDNNTLKINKQVSSYQEVSSDGFIGYVWYLDIPY